MTRIIRIYATKNVLIKKIIIEDRVLFPYTFSRMKMYKGFIVFIYLYLWILFFHAILKGYTVKLEKLK
jgi:hypothetical protein